MTFLVMPLNIEIKKDNIETTSRWAVADCV